MKLSNKLLDLLIIGAGPAGMTAGIFAAAEGVTPHVIDRNPSPGKKLLLTGKGRCNLSNVNLTMDKLMEYFGPGGSFLYSSFSRFGTEKTLDFFHHLGVDTVTEEAGRVFPKSQKAKTLLTAIERKMRKEEVEFTGGIKVDRIIAEDGLIKAVMTSKGEEIKARAYIIAVGGKSFPRTGSMGEGYKWAKKLGHNVITPLPALTSIEVYERWPGHLKGVSIPSTKVRVLQNGKEVLSDSGSILFTHRGLSGPPILNLSGRINRLLTDGPVALEIDLLPDWPENEADHQLLNLLNRYKNSTVKKPLSTVLPASIVQTLLKRAGLSADKVVNSITVKERKAIIRAFKRAALSVKRKDYFDDAMLTAGGIDIAELNPSTFGSRLYRNLFFAGEIIDIQGPSGGYNLQFCWTSGYAAGKAALKYVNSIK